MTAATSDAAPRIESTPGGLTDRVPRTALTSAAALVIALVALNTIGPGEDLVRWAAMAIMAVAALEDLRTRRLRNMFVGPALVLGASADPSVATAAAVLIAVAPFLVFAFVRPGSIGMGDVKFAAPAGALVGFEHVGSMLVATAVLGGVLSLIALVRHGRSGTLAYGPAIAAATLLVGFVAS